MKVRDAIRRLRADGWANVKAKGGQRQYRHPVKRGRVTVPGKPNDDLAPKTLRSILIQAGLAEDQDA